jgi:hypothetical protein
MKEVLIEQVLPLLITALVTFVGPYLFMFIRKAHKKAGVELTETQMALYNELARQAVHYAEEHGRKYLRGLGGSDPNLKPNKAKVAGNYMEKQTKAHGLKPLGNGEQVALIESALHTERARKDNTLGEDDALPRA